MVLDAAPLPGGPAVSRCGIRTADGTPCDWPRGTAGEFSFRPCPEHDFGLEEYGFDCADPDACAEATPDGRVCGRYLPCPEHPAILPPHHHQDEEPPAFASKREAFEWHYRRHPKFGDRAAMSQVARLVGEQAGLQWGTARTYAASILAADAISDATGAAREPGGEQS